jgi:hypothetical protein
MKNKQKNTSGRMVDIEQTLSAKTNNQNKESEKLTYGKQNYLILTAGAVLVIIGFLLMIGGGSEDPNVFKKEELFSFRRITLSPIIVLLGYGVIIYAILKKRKD